MLTLLRKIRKSLIDSGSERKYLLYAVGEIALVVIGILIALQINNWNENRKEEILEIQFLHRLLEDLASDTSYFALRYEQSLKAVQNHPRVIQKMYERQKNIDDIRDLYRQISWVSEDLTIQNVGYTELTNSGNLDIFKNQELKKAIIAYYRECEVAAKGIAEWDEVSTRNLIHLGHLTPNHFKFNPRQQDIFKDLPVYDKDWSYFNDPLSTQFQTLTNTLGVYKLKHSDFLEVYQALGNKSKELLERIIRELELRKQMKLKNRQNN